MNPFSMVLTALWNLLLAHPGFQRDVKVKNRIRFDVNNRDPMKVDSIQDSDLPEVTIMADTSTGNIMDSSSTSKIVRQYTIMMHSGDLRYSEIAAKAEWQIFVALMGWKAQLTPLLWKDKAFVKRVNIITANSGIADPKLNRNLVGWSAVFRIEVEMHFATSDLQDELTSAADEEN